MDMLIGLSACMVSTVCFGSMYVAVRNFNSGDGSKEDKSRKENYDHMQNPKAHAQNFRVRAALILGFFVQWMVGIGIFIVGIIVNMAEEIPQFEPLAMLGGFLWATGNLTALPIIKTIGLAMGLLIWGTTNCVVGWATGRFGLFGIHANVPADPLLNYIGLALVIAGGVLFALIKPTVYSVKNDMPADGVEQASLVPNEPRQVAVTISSVDSQAGSTTQVISEIANSSEPTPLKSRVIAMVAAVFAGCCYGLNFVPIIYIQEHPDEFYRPPNEEIKYTFSHFTGVFLTSTFVFIIYLAYTQNRPFVNSRIVSPSLLAGVLWATAQMAWFISNDKLSQAITFPIDGMMPGIVASLWSVFYFKEIKGSRNIKVLIVAIFITLLGAILVGISKSY